jgi:hypothetical protein
VTDSFPKVVVAPINFRSVDGTRRVYRSGQPLNDNEWRYVDQLIGPTGQVIKLNPDKEGDDSPWTTLGRTLYKIPFPWYEQIVTEPDYQELLDAIGFIGIVPTLIHCTRGIDRTGLVVALWRILYCGWTVEDAEREWRILGGDEWCLPGLQKSFADMAPKLREQYLASHA